MSNPFLCITLHKTQHAVSQFERSGRSGGDDVNIFGLDPSEDAFALVEVGLGLAVVGKDGAEL